MGEYNTQKTSKKVQASAWRPVPAIRAWAIPRPESHPQRAPPPLITFRNYSAKQQGAPAACHRSPLECAEVVKTVRHGRLSAQHSRLILFLLSILGEDGQQQPSGSRSSRKGESSFPVGQNPQQGKLCFCDLWL